MTEIQLLVDDDGNRAALESLLERRYSVVTAGDLRAADLHVVDDRTLPQYRDELLAHDRETDPTFTPTVLVQRDDTRINVELPLREFEDGHSIVDDIVTAPVDSHRLFGRIENLLVRREQSIALTRRYEESEARFEGLFDAIPDPAFVLDADREIIEVNHAFSDVTGVSAADALGSRPSALDVFDDDAGAHLVALLEDGDDAPADDAEAVALRDASGDERDVELHVRSDTVAGEPTTVVVLHDVTALHEKNERLEEFASIVTHDLRSPLQVATGRLPMVAAALPEDDDAHEHLGVVEESLERIDGLIEGVRTLVRKTDVEERERVVLADVARRAWRTVETADDAPAFRDAERTLAADPERLRELLENLFRNAHDHGGDDVSVRVGTTAEGFYVADDGPGIPPEKREQVLETGYTTASDGTGLGLKIVAEVAAAHDWSLAVTESDAGGARFDVTGVAFDEAASRESR